VGEVEGGRVEGGDEGIRKGRGPRGAFDPSQLWWGHENTRAEKDCWLWLADGGDRAGRFMQRAIEVKGPAFSYV